MKFNTFIAILFVYCAVHLQAENTYKQSYQKQFLPQEVGNLYIGMPFSEFIKIKQIAGMEIDSNYSYMYISYTDNTLPANVLNLSYKFDMNDEQQTKEPLSAAPLYEMGIEFTEDIDMDELTAKLFGKPNNVYKKTDEHHFYDKQWIVTTKDKLTLMIRQTGHYIMIAGVIKGTEWSND